MRSKRILKFRKYRHKKLGKIFLLAFILPITSLFIAYLITSLIVLPSMQK